MQDYDRSKVLKFYGLLGLLLAMFLVTIETRALNITGMVTLEGGYLSLPVGFSASEAVDFKQACEGAVETSTDVRGKFSLQSPIYIGLLEYLGFKKNVRRYTLCVKSEQVWVPIWSQLSMSAPYTVDFACLLPRSVLSAQPTAAGNAVLVRPPEAKFCTVVWEEKPVLAP